MLTPAAIKGFTQAKPFRPFRVKMASGETFDVLHPELLDFAGNHVLLTTGSPKALALSMMLMESLRPLPEKSEGSRT